MRLTPGASIGPFEILAPLGAGGMGEVYSARDTRLDRIVAIKLLPSELANPPSRRVERFRNEARAIARITHPNICTLHDVGEDGPAIFLVMEYVDGATLAQRLEDGPLPLTVALRAAVGVADALDYAHRHGVVHRDLKPSNIMLTRDSVKLLDFGLAKLKESDDQASTDATNSALTDVGTIVGTVPYMAPEQIEGHEVDARTDVFSFGVVLYEMLCGRRPFEGDSRASLMAAIVATEPPALSSLQPRTPPALERLIHRCLAKDPDDRWQTARDLAAELRWIGEAGSGSGTSVRTPVTNRPRQRALRWGAGVAGAVALIAAFAATAPSMWPRQPSIAQYQPVTYRRGVVSSARFTPDGKSFVYSASWEGEPYAAFLGRPESPDARDLQLPDARILSISRTGDMAVLFGPQNIQRAFGVRTMARIPMAGGARRELLTGVVDADWIPGTDTLAVIRDPGGGRPWTVEFPAGNTLHEPPAAWSLRVSPDGNRIAFFEGPALFGSAPRTVVTVIDKSGHTSTIARDLVGLGLAWAPSGQEVWFTATRPGQHAPQLLAASLSGVERTVQRAPDWLVLHDISADGRVLLTRNTIRINMACKPPGEARERDLTWLVGSAVTGLSPDGKTATFADPLGARTAANPMLFRRGLDGSPAVALGEGGGGALSPDGKWVLATSGKHLVLLPTGAGAMVTLPMGSVVQAGAGKWLGDSRRIVFTGDEGDDTPRGYVQEIPAGAPRPFTPAGVVLAGNAAERADQSVLGRAGARWMLFSLQGGEGRAVPALTTRDFPVQWSQDGRSVYAVDSVQGPPPPGADVFLVDLTTGGRVLWKSLIPPDPVGVEQSRGAVVITPDGQSYCYSYQRRLGDLFIVDGLN
jgi:hypothetical protein